MIFKRTKSSFISLLKKKYQQPSNFKELIYVLKFNGRLFFTNFIGIEHFFTFILISNKKFLLFSSYLPIH
jgi:hypothetical protein